MLRQFIELYRGFSRIQSLIHITRTELNCSVNSPIGVHVFLTERPSSLQCLQPINTKYKLRRAGLCVTLGVAGCDRALVRDHEALRA